MWYDWEDRGVNKPASYLPHYFEVTIDHAFFDADGDGEVVVRERLEGEVWYRSAHV